MVHGVILSIADEKAAQGRTACEAEERRRANRAAWLPALSTLPGGHREHIVCDARERLRAAANSGGIRSVRVGVGGTIARTSRASSGIDSTGRNGGTGCAGSAATQEQL